MKPLVLAAVAALGLVLAGWPGSSVPAPSAPLAAAATPATPAVQGESAAPAAAGRDHAAEPCCGADLAPRPDEAPPPAEDEVELCVGPLEAISETSTLVLLRVTPERLERLEVIAKPLAFRELNRGSGPYVYRLLDAKGEPLFSGEFELPGLCPLADHDAPHLEGHVVIEHETVLALRVPELPGATQLEVVRHVPLADTRPYALGTVDLRSPHETVPPARLPALPGE